MADPDMNFIRFGIRFQFFVATEEGTIVGFTANHGHLEQASIVVDESRRAVFTGPRRILIPVSRRPNLLKNLVELVGIEPTTSSLRTMRSPSNPRCFFSHLPNVRGKNSPNYWDVIGT
jgi:hypothetical protein